jgi:hypothetical protein
MATNPRKLFREVLGDTNDPLAAIRAVREVFGLSVAEAKEVWLQATGRAATLSEHQEELAAALPRIVCPKCRSDRAIERKLHVLPVGLGYVNPAAAEAVGSDFVNGFWCSSCQVGFVPDHLLDELGLVSVRPI